MPSVPDVADDGSAKILELLLSFLASPSPRSRAVVQAVVSLVVVLSMAYVAGVIVARFAGFALPHLHLAAPEPASATAACYLYLVQFVVLVCTPVFAWLILMAVQVAAFVFVARRYARDLSSNVLG